MSSVGMLGGSSDLYKNRYHAEYDQLKYDRDDYVYYPDVLRRRYAWMQPQGGATFSGQDFPYASTTAGVTGVSSKLTFQVPTGVVTDPTSYAINFRCYVGDNGGMGSAGTTALCNYAHSVFNQITVRFVGSSSSQIEQVQSYNIFSSMLYLFYGTNYVAKIQASNEGYNLTNATRAWNGRSFMLPINLGFFLTLRKYIPGPVLPLMQIEMVMESNARATCQKTVGTAVGTNPYYFINSAQLIYSIVDVTLDFDNKLREEINDGAEAMEPVRLDFVSWINFSTQIAAGLVGEQKYLVSGNIPGMRKIMFSLIQNLIGSGTGTATNLGNDTINSFNQNNLQGYRIQIGGTYYPEQSIYVNQGQTTSTTALSTDVSQAYYFNMLAMGVRHNPWSDLNMSWGSSDSFNGSGSDIGTQWVYLLPTEIDDAGLPTLTDTTGSAPLTMVWNFGAAVPTNGVTANIFVNVHRCLHLFPGNQVRLIEG